jgi:hypothetical protein
VITLIRAAARLIKALGALTALTTLLAALPYALVHFVGWPLPRAVPTWTGVQAALTSPPSTTLYINVLACLIWVCWLVLAVSFLVEFGYALRQVHAPHIPGLGPGQLLAAALIAAIGLGAGAARPAQAAASSPLPPTTPAATAPAHPTPPPASTITAPGRAAAAPSTTTSIATAPTSVTVAPGDTLYAIAKSTLGNGDDWPTLYHENTATPQPDGARLTDPDLIRPGWTILIDPATTSPADTTPTPDPAPVTPAPAPAHTTTSPAPAHPAPPPVTTATSHADPSHQSPHTTNHPAPSAHRHSAPSGVRIDLTDGGMIAGSLFTALLGALALTRRHRRRFSDCFWPSHATTDHHDELPRALRPAPVAAGPAGSALPASVVTDLDDDGLDEYAAPLTLGAADRDVASQPQPAADGDPWAQSQAPNEPHESDEPEEPGGLGPIAVAYAGRAEITVGQVPGGMGLTGPGALGAARAIAAAVLSDGAKDNHPERARLIVSREDLALLLERDPGHLHAVTDGVGELDVTDDLPAALALLEEHLTYRARQLQEYDCADLDELAERHGDLEPHPPLVLLAVTRQENAGRLKATAAAGVGLRAHAVLLGSHPDQPTWHITNDGKITGEPDERIPADAHTFDLPAHALDQTLLLLAQTAGHGLRDQAPGPGPDPAGPLAVPLGLGHYADPEPHDAGPRLLQEPIPKPKPEPELEPAQSTTAPEPERAAEPAGPGPAIEASSAGTDQEQAGGQDHPVDPAPQTPAAAPARALRIVTRDPAEHHGPGPGQQSELPHVAATDAVTAILEQFHSKTVRVRVLGPLLIEHAKGPISKGPRGDSRRVAARLAVHHHRGQSGEELAELWPDLTGKDLTEARKTALAYLRGPLKTATGATSAQFVTHTNNRYRLEPNLVGIDLAVFDQLRALAARSHDPHERAAAAEAALGLRDGELLTDYDEEWTAAPRAAVRREALASAALLAQLADEAGERDAALAWWEHARTIDDNEQVYREIMKLQAALGRRVDVIATRDLLITNLESIGEYPSPVTELLLGELLRERPRLPATAGPR